MKFLTQFLTDLAKLKLPVTASAVAALFLSVVEPFGIDLDPAQISGGLVVIGAVAAYLDHLLGD
jgi:hypothetical protein